MSSQALFAGDRFYRSQFDTGLSSYTVFKKDDTYYADPGFPGGTPYSGTDAATVMGDARNALTSGNILIKRDTYPMTKRLIPKSKVSFKGEGRGQTILQPTAGFTTVGGTTGVIDFADTSIHDTIEISDMTFDLTQNTDALVRAIGQRGSQPIQHLSIHDVSMDLGTQHNGIVLESLGISATIPSFDIRLKGIHAHNGNGTINLYLNAAAIGSTYYDVLVEDIQSDIDVNGVGDDRVAIIANFPAGPGPAEVRDVTVRNIRTNIASAVTSGTIQSVKLDVGANSYMHDILIDGVHHSGVAAAGVIGSPIATVISGSSYLQNVKVRNIFSNNAERSKILLSRRDPSPFILVDGYTARKCKDSTVGLEIYDTQGNQGDEQVIFRNIDIETTVAASGNKPVGLMFTGGTNQGANGNILVDGVLLNGFKTGLSNNLDEAGDALALVWTNFNIKHARMVNVVVPFSLSATSIITVRDSPGFNPKGALTNPIGTSTIGFYGGTTGTPVASTDYTIIGTDVLVTSTGGTGVSISIKDGGGNVISSGLTTLQSQRIPTGYKINFGAFSVAPSVSVGGE